MNMSDRVCQFFLRGRCQMENCEFKHEKSSDMEDLVDGATLEWVIY